MPRPSNDPRPPEMVLVGVHSPATQRGPFLQGARAYATRRAVLGTGAAAAGIALVAGCGSGGGGRTSEAIPPGSTGELARVPTAEVPLEGSIYLSDVNIVVTQPSAGTLKAFDATCTHQGCRVSRAVDGHLLCPCHGSTFDISTGAPTGGPAPTPLKELTATVSGDTVVVTP